MWCGFLPTLRVGRNNELEQQATSIYSQRYPFRIQQMAIEAIQSVLLHRSACFEVFTKTNHGCAVDPKSVLGSRGLSPSRCLQNAFVERFLEAVCRIRIWHKRFPNRLVFLSRSARVHVQNDIQPRKSHCKKSEPIGTHKASVNPSIA